MRRCSYNQDLLFSVAEILTTNKGLAKTSTYVHRMEQLAVDHGFVSLRGVEFITINNVLDFSVEYRTELYQLIQEILSKPRFDVLCIHDEFKCHPKYMNHLRECYVTILAELADSTVGQQIIREVRNDPDYVLTKLSNNLGDKIMKSEYFLS